MMQQERFMSFTLQTLEGKQDMQIPIDNLIVAGWVGRNKAFVQQHIEEMERFGVPPPERVPTYMHLTTNLLTTSQTLEVISPSTSGEVECVLLRINDRFYLGLGSDHTDRVLEKTDIPASKQVCGKLLSPVIWDYLELEDHLDSLHMRSWMASGKEELLYQEGRLEANRPPMQLFEEMPGRDAKEGNLCLFCGTFPTQAGIRYGDRFTFEIEDPLLDRRIHHAYTVRVLPQYV